MADGSDLPVGEYSILPTEDVGKYVIAVKLSEKVFNHLQRGARTASICFGKNDIFTVDNEQYNFTELPNNNVETCYYQSAEMFAEIGDVKKRFVFRSENIYKVREATQKAEEDTKKKKIVALGGGKQPPKSTNKRLPTTVKKQSRIVVPAPAPRPLTPPPVRTPTTSTPPQQSSLSPPPSTPPLVSPPQPHPQPSQKVLSPPLASPPPSTPPSVSSTPSSTPAPTSRRPPVRRNANSPAPVVKETPPSKPPQKITLRTQLIHDLALAPKTAGKLAEKRKVTTEEVMHLLPTMAKYAPPGLWHPIPIIFKEVDVDWHEYMPEDRAIVAEKVKEALAKLASEPAPPVEDKSIAASTKNLKDMITLDPSEKRPRSKGPVNTPPLSTSPTLDLSPTETSSESSNKKRPRDSASSAPSKAVKLNPPIPPELLSPPPSFSATPQSSSTPSAAPATTPSMPSPTPIPLPPSLSSNTTTTTPTPTPIQKRKPPPKPPSNPIPTPISSSSSSSSFVPPSKTASTPTNKALPPKSKTTPPSKPVPPTKNTPTPPPKSATAKVTPPPKPTPLPSKQHAARNAKNSVKNVPPPSSSSSSASASASATRVPPMRVPEVPTFHITINNSQDNDKYRRIYHEKYGTYKELHQKLTDNKEHFLKLDDEWKQADVDARNALSVKIESAYLERRADVERMQEQHGALHGELSAIKDAMRKYADSARASTQGNATAGASRVRAAQGNAGAVREAKKAKTESPPLKQKRPISNNNNNNNNENNNNQSTPTPKPAQRIPPKPPSQKQNPVATKS